jgi:hypothetical protein
LLFRGVTRGSDIMRKSLKRVLDRQRAKTNDALRKRTSVRAGLQDPSRMQGTLTPVHGRS